MFDLIYSCTILPLELIMQFVLEAVVYGIHSYGMALIAVSAIVSFGALPLYHVAEKWQDAERDIQNKMKSKVVEFKSVLKGYELHACLNVLYRQHRYHPIFAVRTSVGILIQIPFFLAAYQFLSHYEPLQGVQFLVISNLGKPDALLQLPWFSVNVLPFVMTGINLFSAYIYGKKTTLKENIQLYGIAIFFLVFLYDAPSGLLIYWSFNNFFGLIKNIVYHVIGEVRERGEASTEVETNNTKMSIIDSHQLYWLGILTALFLLFVGAPLGVLDSGSLSDFGDSLSFYIEPLLGVFFLGIFLFTLAYIVLPVKLKKAFGVILSSGAFFIVLNQFLFAGNYGDMSNFVFQSPLVIEQLHSIINGIVLVSSFALVIIAVWHKKVKVLKNILLVCLIASIALGVYNAIGYTHKREEVDFSKIDKFENLFELSKEGKNVVILMLDRMIGGYVPSAFEMMPDLKEKLKGFKWFPKSLSEGTFTISGVPAIVGGYDYRIDSINTTRTRLPIANKINEAYRVLPYNFSKAGFKSTMMGPSLMFDKKNKQYLESVKITNPVGRYNDLWSESNKVFLPKDDVHEKLIQFGLFRSAPLMIRKSIYSDGTWLGKSLKDLELNRGLKEGVVFRPTVGEKKSTLKNWSVLDLLPKLSQVVDDSVSRYYFMTNNLTHEPWAINESLELDFSKEIAYPDSMYNKLGKNLFSVKHMYGTAAALKLLSQWFVWMQEQGVYDNTRIIIVSDHGREVYNPMFHAQKVPLRSNEKRAPLVHLLDYELPWFHNAFFVKDFNAAGPLSVDSTLRIPADVPAIALKGIVKGVNPFTKHPIKEEARQFPYTVGYHEWRLTKQKKTAFDIQQYYTLKNDKMFDPLNWVGHRTRAVPRQTKGEDDVQILLSGVTRELEVDQEFSFDLTINKPCSVNVAVKPFYSEIEKRNVLMSVEGSRYSVGAREFLPGVNAVYIDVYNADKKVIQKYHYEIFNKTNGAEQLIVPLLEGTQDFGRIMENKSVNDMTLKVGASDYSWGFGTHAESIYTYKLLKEYKKMEFAHGMSGHSGCGDGAEFIIALNGKKVYGEKSFIRKEITKAVVDLRGVRSIDFITNKNSNSQCDHVNWVHPTLFVRGDHE